MYMYSTLGFVLGVDGRGCVASLALEHANVQVHLPFPWIAFVVDCNFSTSNVFLPYFKLTVLLV